MNDCFAMKNGKCTALIKAANCNGCVFYKTAERNRRECLKAMERCQRLGIPYGKDYVRTAEK